MESKQGTDLKDQTQIEGSLKCRHEERVELILCILKHRFGNLPPELPSRVLSVRGGFVHTHLLLHAARADSLEEFQRLTGLM